MKLWKKLGSKYFFKHPVLNLRSDSCRMNSGKIAENYFVVEKHDFAMVVAFTKDKRLIMVEQYRHPVGKIDLEFPAGFVHKGEKPLAAAKRELLEETGYKAKTFKKIGEFYASPGVLSNSMHVFFACGAEKISKQHLDEHEEIEIKLLSLSEVEKLAKQGKIKDVGTNLLLQLIQRFFLK